MADPYLELINCILSKQRQAIGTTRVVAIGSKVRCVVLDQHGCAIRLVGPPEQCLDAIARAFVGAFPLAESIITLQLLTAAREHPDLLIPDLQV